MVAERFGLKREILNGLSHHRVDPTGLKIPDNKPAATRGQGAIVVGTLIPREAFTLWIDPKVFGIVGEWLFDRPDEILPEPIREWRSEALREAPAEEREKEILEAAEEFLVEQTVAVKQLECPRDDDEHSTKFFKSFVNELSLMTSLSHPNTIKFLAFVEDAMKGDAWIILSWQPNGNVRDFLKSGEWDIPERISL
ncbi:hypothetical protein FS837_001318, partial [Tulasnella sp. UAMH 9824]